jgi:hypothetical protein
MKKYFKCNCGGELLEIEHDKEFGTTFAIFSLDYRRGLKNRLRLAWKALTGNPYNDMILFNDQDIADIVDHLIEIQNYEI